MPRLIDDRAAGDVDEKARLAQRRENPGVDEMARRRAARNDEREEVARPGHGGEIVVVTKADLRLHVAAVIDDHHAECGGALRQGLADASHADDAHGLAAELAAKAHRAFRPLPRADVAVPLRDATGNGQGQRHAEIGDAIGQDARRIGDSDAARLRCRQVDGIDADAVRGDDLCLGQRVHQFGASARLAHRRDGRDAVAQAGKKELAIRRLPQPMGDEIGVERVEGRRIHRRGDEDFLLARHGSVSLQ